MMRSSLSLLGAVFVASLALAPTAQATQMPLPPTHPLCKKKPPHPSCKPYIPPIGKPVLLGPFPIQR